MSLTRVVAGGMADTGYQTARPCGMRASEHNKLSTFLFLIACHTVDVSY